MKGLSCDTIGIERESSLFPKAFERIATLDRPFMKSVDLCYFGGEYSSLGSMHK